jgi:hypothetical protein
VQAPPSRPGSPARRQLAVRRSTRWMRPAPACAFADTRAVRQDDLVRVRTHRYFGPAFGLLAWQTGVCDARACSWFPGPSPPETFGLAHAWRAPNLIPTVSFRDPFERGIALDTFHSGRSVFSIGNASERASRHPCRRVRGKRFRAQSRSRAGASPKPVRKWSETLNIRTVRHELR